MSQSNKLDFIQAARGFAAITVVACHFRDLFKGTEYELFAEKWLTPGAFGVDLFFIISGFIIAYSGVKYSRRDSFKFLSKRFLRIWPPYAFWTIIFSLIISGGDLGHINLSDLYKSLSFIPLNLDAPIYFGSAILYPGWTLNYEAYFYLTFSLCMIFGSYRYIVLLGFFIFTVMILPSLLGLNDPKPALLGAGYLNLTMQRILLEFAFGVLCALVYIKKIIIFTSNLINKLLFYIALIIPIIAYIFGIKTNDHGPTNFGMFYMISFFILILCSDWIEKNTKFPKWLIFSGNISFSIYLTHIIVIHLISILYQPLNFDALTKAILIIISSIPVIFFISYLSYVILEKKLHDLFMNNMKKKAVA